VAAAAGREPADRPGLVGLQTSQRGDALQLVLCGTECVLPAGGDCGTGDAAEAVAVDAGVHGAAERAAADGGSTRSAVYAGVLSDAVRAGRGGALPVDVLGLAVGFEAECVRRHGLIQLDVGVNRSPRLAIAFVKELLHSNAARR